MTYKMDGGSNIWFSLFLFFVESGSMKLRLFGGTRYRGIMSLCRIHKLPYITKSCNVSFIYWLRCISLIVDSLCQDGIQLHLQEKVLEKEVDHLSWPTL